MNEEQEVNGVNTIKGLRGEPPQEIHIPHKLMHKQQVLMQTWNPCFIAVIPYCFKCRVPLVWHQHPKNDILFHCPACRRRWVKGEDWDKNE